MWFYWIELGPVIDTGQLHSHNNLLGTAVLILLMFLSSEDNKQVFIKTCIPTTGTLILANFYKVQTSFQLVFKLKSQLYVLQFNKML